MMNRRVFIGTLTGGLLAAPLAAEAQQQTGRAYRIGVLSPRPVPFLLEPFVVAMRSRGWVEGRDFVMDVRVTDGDTERATAFATELMNRKADLVLTVTTPLALEARRASTAIPIVMMTSGQPVAAGLAASLARPGGNVTGSSVYAGGELWGKYLELLKAVVPRMTRVAAVWDWVPPNILAEEMQPLLDQFRQAARVLGLALRFQAAATQAHLDQALSVLGSESVDALFATSGPVNGQPRNSSRLVKFATARRIPSMTDFQGGLFRAGFLMTYSANPEQLGYRAADFVDRILKGAKPADLPIEQPAKFDLIINLKTAKALGLSMPPSVLQRADQVVE